MIEPPPLSQAQVDGLPAAETIRYRGRRVVVEVVQVDACRDDGRGAGGFGVDALLIDARGRCFYRRQRFTHSGDGVAPARVLVHRLRLAGAILWTLGRDSSDIHLRRAVWGLLRSCVQPYTLDCQAQALVRAEVRAAPGTDARDLVNAGGYFLLGDEDADSALCREGAKLRRLGRGCGHYRCLLIAD